MLKMSPTVDAELGAHFDRPISGQSRTGRPPASDQCTRAGSHRRGWSHRDSADTAAIGPAADVGHPAIQISPSQLAKRHSVMWPGMGAELLQSKSPGRLEYRFHAPRHLLVAYEQGSRREGETFIEGLPRSARRDIARKLALVPAGCEYHEWHELSTSVRLMFFHFDPGQLQIDIPDMSLTPRLFFEDATLWDTVLKLKRLLETPTPKNLPYFEALGVVLVHEVARLDSRADRVGSQVRGGLAAWQQRVVTAFIEEHLAEQISLTTLAQLARLSPYHFCRAFKQSFGVPPHRYHTSLRIERAKVLLQRRPLSVTEIGMTLGFSETSSFTAAFRKATGLTPSGYHRSVA
jgi:AraC family transcriptional regulator